eukprot:scaffold6466_cov38-Attheya_sp.AAC.6
MTTMCHGSFDNYMPPPTCQWTIELLWMQRPTRGLPPRALPPAYKREVIIPPLPTWRNTNWPSLLPHSLCAALEW